VTELLRRADGPQIPLAAGGIRGRRPFLTTRRRETTAGWLMSAPVIVLLVVFLVIPIVMAAWVSLSDWNGIGSPFASGVHAVGAKNYEALLIQPGLPQQQLGESLRNNLYYVILVVPVQTALALGLALFVSRRRLTGRGFFRTAYYFPSITSSVAVSILFLYIFGTTGVVNAIIGYLGGGAGPNWFDDPNGVLQMILSGLGVTTGPSALAGHGFLGLSWWNWLAGPSVAMIAIIVLAIWTTSGTFMLIFLPAIYAIPSDLTEAAVMDGANGWQQFRQVTLPMLRPALFLVLTLGLISTWQVFDQIYLMSQGNPEGTTLTPAFLSYLTSFGNQQWGQGAAIAFILFALIVVLTIVQRMIISERRTGGAT
jgi:multiple sugar transport system permease protein